MKNNIQEVSRQLGKKAMNNIHQAMDDYAKEVYGDKYNELNAQQTKKFFPKGVGEVRYNADVSSGLFSLGNLKLSPDTLIINFTSALNCPSLNYCPITQKACYAVAGEKQYKDSRRKHFIVQNLVVHAKNRDMLNGLFDIAELYIIEAKEHSKTPIKYIRYNETGDFIDQNMLIKAAEFSKKARDKYQVMSMAYTANKRLDPSQEVDGEPIDTIIAMNRSRSDIPYSKGSLNRNFFGIPMKNFSTNPNINLENAYCDVEYIQDADLNNLKVEAPVKDSFGNPTIPILNKGSWDGGSGYYYVCPCSFWKYNKNKATKEYLVSVGIMNETDPVPEDKRVRQSLTKQLNPEQKKTLNKLLNKVVSPCGLKCAVCHDIQGGMTPDRKITGIKDYAVLAATHGATAGNYDSKYADAKRRGDDTAIYKGDKKNPHGIEKKYQTDAPINPHLFMKSQNDSNAIEKEKEAFKEQYQRLFGNIL